MAPRSRYVLVCLLLLTGVLSCTAILGINTDYDENKCNDDIAEEPLKCNDGACFQLIPGCDEQGLPAKCPAPKTDADEICNNLDDNCNREIDEGCDCEVNSVKVCYSGSPLTRNVGLCRDGQHECKNGSWAECIDDILPNEEICDQFDNDCDGEVDEDCECADGSAQPCYGGADVTLNVGECVLGTQTCDNGVWGDCKGDVLPGVEATPADCNGVDDDCDGQVDENPPCICTVGQTQECYGGNPELAGIGECKKGTQQCVKGAWGPCEDYGVPGTEVCNALDDDCNGEPDDGDLGVGGPCNVPGVQGPCKNGVYVCSTNGLECQQIVLPVSETCNGTDDDCDGVPDNGNPDGGASCFVAGNPQPLGECAKGEIVCQGGEVVCKQVNLPKVEECDGEDDDCNGFVDNGNLCCPDLSQNGTETDVDCGGPCMKKCVPGQKCVQDFDCESLSCNNGFCQNPTCNDITKNGTEADVDCGGPCPIKCSIGQSCNVPSDCVSTVCTQKVCLSPGCMDAVKNGTESDTDCGGASCPKCDDAKTCQQNSDCKSLVCKQGLCQPALCSDTIKNGTESDTDCGGMCPTKCGINQGCAVGADCLSKVCTGQLCQEPSCADLVQNGSESYTDCGGSCPLKCNVGEPCGVPNDCASNVCQAGFCAKKDPGTPCSAAGECSSNNCVDGVCCNTACSGLCLACTNALKGSGADGTCGPIGAGADPANECAQDTLSSCGQTGSCNGAGACALFPFGTVCEPPSCGADGVTLTVAKTCNGSGTCVTPMPATNNCTPGICENNACKTTCPNGQCSPNAYCNNGVCLAKKPDGDPCDPAKLGQDCLNNSCMDGVCCNVPCGNPCEACTANKTGGTTGICANIPSGQDPDNECVFQPQANCGTTGSCSGFASCQLYPANAECQAATCAADGTSVINQDVCDGSGSCIDKGMTLCGGFACSAGACTNLKVIGSSCLNNAECGSGFCADGKCCNSACVGPCDVCAAGLGASADGMCTNTTGAGSPSCAPYVCKGLSAACPGVCATDTDCIAGYYCGAGSCQQKQVNGQTCVAANQCQSGFCVDGVCCNDQCVGNCNACSAAAGAPVSGTCSNVTGAGNPSCAPYTCSGGSSSCPNACVNDTYCASTHYCNGSTCTPKLANGQVCGAGNQCASSFCADGVCCNTACGGACDACAAALGALVDGTCGTVAGLGNPSCTPYLCTGSSAVCPVSCSNDNGCISSHYCNGGSCLAKVTTGQACTTANQCQSGFCADGVCCDTACGGACNACSVGSGAPSNGTCANVTGAGNPSCGPYVCSGSSATCPISCTGDAGCTAGNYCNPANLCVSKLVLGQACTAANQCQSGSCADGVCCNNACSGECNACSTAAGAPSNGTCANVTGAGNPSCGTYVCSGASATCPAACSGDLDCANGNYCNAASQCVAKLTNGQACLATNQCQSGFCADSVCCNSACTGSCNGCSTAAGAPSSGTCASVTGAGNPSCGAYVCDGMSATCPATCDNDVDCSAGNYCNAATQCVSKLANGQACTATNQCQSGNCADDVCCNSACTESCNACSTAAGAPSNGTCASVTGAGNPSCGAYLCDGMSATCPATCDNDTDCSAGSFCNASSQCITELANGQACAAGSECQSGNCTDAVCCDSACTGSCNACSTAAGAPSNGTCASVTGAGNPSCGAYVCDGMSALCPATCDNDTDCSAGNYCNASSQCVTELANGQACTATNQCQSGNCTDAVCCDSACAGECNACSTAAGAPSNGTCANVTGGGNPSCGTYVCDGTSATCPGTCMSDASCSAGNYCNASNLCVPKLGAGQACSIADHCQSNFCADSVCCDSACAGSCDACSIAAGAPSNGTCANITGVGDPSCGAYVCDGMSATCPAMCMGDGDCAAGYYCNGNACDIELAAGVACVTANQCGSGICEDGVCCQTSCAGCGTCAAGTGLCSLASAGGAGSPSCSPYVCDGTSASCPGTCVSDASCSDGNYCNASNLCVPKLGAGQACSTADHCQSNFCADSVCCDSACAGSCDACSIAAGAPSNGTCANITGVGDPSCGAYVCDGMSATCPAMCMGDGDCAAGYYCNGNACDIELAAGVACVTANQCGSGICEDGVCCQTSCAGCGTCAAGTGLCSLASAGGAGSPSCSPYVCDGTSAFCPVQCDADSDCAADYFCAGVDGASGACAQRTLFLVTGSSTAIHGAVFTAGAWLVTTIGGPATTTTTDVAVAVDGTGRGVGIVRDSAAGNLRSTLWTSGSWTNFANLTGNPTSSTAPAIDAPLESGTLQAAYVRTAAANDHDSFYTSLTASWVSEAAITTAANAPSAVAPDIAVLPNGNPVLLFVANKDLKSTTRASGIWQAAVNVDTGSSAAITVPPTVVALTGGTSDLAAINVRSNSAIYSSLRSAGVWSSPVQIGSATTVSRVGMAALPGGAAVAAYRGNVVNALNVSFLDPGTSAWSATAVVSATVFTNAPPAVARGVGGAVVEIVYISLDDNKPYHIRCNTVVSNACTSWTTPVKVHDNTVTSVALAATP